MPGHGRGYACSRASISRLGSDNGTMWDERTDVRRADTSVCPYMTSVYIYFPMCQHYVGADRRVRPIQDGWMHMDGGHARMQTDGEAVQQTLTAVWRRRRHLRDCGTGGTDHEEVERVWSWFDRLRGRRILGGVPQVSLRATQRLAIVGRCCKTPRLSPVEN